MPVAVRSRRGWPRRSSPFTPTTWRRPSGRPTADLDPEVAEVGLAFMTSSMTDDMRGDAFGPEQPAPADADAYQRIAAFAGRSV